MTCAVRLVFEGNAEQSGQSRETLHARLADNNPRYTSEPASASARIQRNGATRRDRTGDLLITKFRFLPYAIDSTGHSAPPTCRSLGVNPGEDHPSAPECSFYDCGGSIGILADDGAPAGELGAILPVLIERWRSSSSNRHRCLADTPTFGGVETEPHTRGQIQTVIGGIIMPAKKPTPQIPR